MTQHRLLSFIVGGVTAAAAVLVSVRQASACGGFFCNSAPPGTPPPIAQTGENVAFAVDDDPATGARSLEAHIQIFYTGPADKFSWVVPVEAEPKLEIGTNTMFGWLSTLTQPAFSVRWHVEGTCKSSGGADGGGGAGGSGGYDGGSADAPSGGGGGVDVSFRGDVGPYDAAVIHSTDPKDPMPLKKWLADNMYFVSDEASGLIDTYVAENKYFVALKLINGKSVQEIAPIVLKFAGTSPCVPLRLTSIASIADLRVNLWVVGKSRVVPSNYIEMEVNQARIDWFSRGSNYQDLVKQAANEAGGNAFVAEYAGTARLLDARLWTPGRWNLPAFRAAVIPPDFISQILAQTLPRDGQLMALMRKHIPLPDKLKAMGVTENAFWSSNAYYWSMYKADFAPFDSSAFADDIDASIVRPARGAQEMFDRHPYLTRLATFISPEEMTKDPMFTFNSSLPDMPVAHVADAYRLCGKMLYKVCEAPVRLVLPGGRIVRFRPTTTYYCGSSGEYGAFDRGDLDRMPALEVGWKRAETGEGMAAYDNRGAIGAAIDKHNAGVNKAVPPPPGEPPGGVYPDGGWGGAGGGPSAEGGGGCGCRTPGAGPETVSIGAFTLLALAAAVGRRRRR